MRFKGVVSGLKKMQKLYQELEKEQKKQTLIALTDSIFAVQKTAIDSIKTKKGSRTDTRYNPKREQLVSPDKQPPNADLGGLVDALSRGLKIDKEKLEATIEPNLDYAFSLEFGTSNMAARPYMRPALLQNKFAIQDKFKESVAVTIQKVKK